VAQQTPAGLLRFEVLKTLSDAFLQLEGATSCDTTDPANRKPIRDVSAEYCSALYVVDTARESAPSTYELRLTTPRRNLIHPERGCIPPQSVNDAEYPARQLILIGLIHNHPCWRGPSTPDMGLWPLDFDATQGMARLDLYPGNAVTAQPPVLGDTPLVAQSYIFARKGQQPIYLLLRTTGDVHEWDGSEWKWRSRCEPDSTGGGPARCAPAFNPGEN
jgi:hypothetical protein